MKTIRQSEFLQIIETMCEHTDRPVYRLFAKPNPADENTKTDRASFSFESEKLENVLKEFDRHVKSWEPRWRRWITNRAKAWTELKDWLPMNVVPGVGSDPFEAKIRVGWTPLEGQVYATELVRIAPDKKGWPAVRPCHPDGAARTAICMSRRKRRFGIDQIIQVGRSAA